MATDLNTIESFQPMVQLLMTTDLNATESFQPMVQPVKV